MIYIVEDDRNIQEIELFALKNSGYQAAGFGELFGDGFIRDGLEGDARAGNSVGLGAFFAGRRGGVHGDALTVRGQIRLGLVLGKTELEVVFILKLDHREDEVGGVGRAVRIGGRDEIETGEGVDGVHQVVAGQRGIAIEIGDGSGRDGVLGETESGQAESRREHQRDKAFFH